MIQQGANLFDKGLNLDTNPITIDNHTLTGALNATMITMNGNELVLLNDMGNALVDLAQLPEGYVPVGMKEHGGIIYVASYNPIKGESLIGSFPSPQRNLSSEDDGEKSLKNLRDFVVYRAEYLSREDAVKHNRTYYIPYGFTNNYIQAFEWDPDYYVYYTKDENNHYTLVSNPTHSDLSNYYVRQHNYHIITGSSTNILTYRRAENFDHSCEYYSLDSNNQYVRVRDPQLSDYTNYYIRTFPEYIRVSSPSFTFDSTVQYYTRTPGSDTYTPVNNPSRIGLFYYIKTPSRIFISTQINGWVENTKEYATLVGNGNIIRTGDKFIIGSENIGDLNDGARENYIQLSALIKASDNGSIDITEDLIEPENNFEYIPFIWNLSGTVLNAPNESDYTVHKSKVSGELILKAELILPSYINVSLKANPEFDAQQLVTGTTLQVKCEAFDEDGNIWDKNEIWGYALRMYIENSPGQSYDFKNYKVDKNGFLCDANITPLLAEIFTGYRGTEILTYEVYPIYEYQQSLYGSQELPLLAKIKPLGRKNTINISDLGTGKVVFNGLFKYYNDIPSNKFQLDYTIEAYIDGSDHTLNRIYLLMFDIEHLCNGLDFNLNLTLRNPQRGVDIYRDLYRIEIDLPTNDYFGTFSALFDYEQNIELDNSLSRVIQNNNGTYIGTLNPPSNIATHIDKGHYYIGRLVAQTDVLDNNNNPINWKSDWYAIITSSLTNKFYERGDEVMIKLKNPNSSSDLNIYITPDTTCERTLTQISNETSFYGDSSPIINTSNIISNNWNSDKFPIGNYTINKGSVKLEHLLTTKLLESFNVNLNYSLPYCISDVINNTNPTLIHVYRHADLVGVVNELHNVGDNYWPANTDRRAAHIAYNNLTYLKYDLDYIDTGGRILTSNATPAILHRSNNEVFLDYMIHSAFVAKFLKNQGSDTSISSYEFDENYTGEAFVPYMSLFYTLDGFLRTANVLGGLKSNITTEQWDSVRNSWLDDQNAVIGNRIHYLEPENIFAYRLQARPELSSISVEGSFTPQLGSRFATDWNEYGISLPDSVALLETGWTTSTPNWDNIKTYILPKLQERGYADTTLLLWEGNGSTSYELPIEQGDDAGKGLVHYSIPMLRDFNGNFYPLDLVWDDKGGQKYSLTDIVRAFNCIYVCLPGVSCQYKCHKANPNQSIYNESYSTLITYELANPDSNEYILTNLRRLDNVTPSTFCNYSVAAVNNISIQGNNFLDCTNSSDIYQLPTIKKSLDTYTESFDYQIQSPDCDELNSIMLDPSNLDNRLGALVVDLTGSNFITNPYHIQMAGFEITSGVPEVSNNGTIKLSDQINSNDTYDALNEDCVKKLDVKYTRSTFDKSKVYFHIEGKGADSRLVDCMDPGLKLEVIHKLRWFPRYKYTTTIIHGHTFIRRGKLKYYRNYLQHDFWGDSIYGENKVGDFLDPCTIGLIGRFGLNIAKAIREGYLVTKRSDTSGKLLLVMLNGFNQNISTIYQAGSKRYTSPSNHTYFYRQLTSITIIKNLALFDDNYMERSRWPYAVKPMWLDKKNDFNTQLPATIPEIFNKQLFRFSGFNGSTTETIQRLVRRYDPDLQLSVLEPVDVQVVIPPVVFGLQVNNIEDFLWNETIIIDTNNLYRSNNWPNHSIQQ